MPDADRLAGFLAASLVLLLIPGPAVLYIVTRGIDQGREAALVSVLGAGTGSFVQAIAAALGLTAVLSTSATAFTTVKLGGAAYLIALGVRRLLSRHVTVADESRPVVRLRRVYWQGVLVATLNPKTALFFLAFLPQFVDSHRGTTTQILVLGVLFVVLGLCTDAGYALAAGTVGHALLRRPAFGVIRRYVTGGVYVSLGVAAAVAGRDRD